jgi:glycosyltransferase involved in cell wall biosynthesis
MQQRNISLSIFFPTYNEEENIATTIEQADAVARTITDDYEIIVVNDGSTDRTAEVTHALRQTYSHLKIVDHKINQGYGAAVWSGVQAASKEYVFFTDADLQFDLTELKNLVEFVPEHDVVIGYRARRQDPFMRLVNARGWNILNRLLFGLRVRDIDCAFKLFKRSLVKDVPVKTRGAMLSAELLIRLQRQGVMFKEIPVTHLPRTRGSATGAKPAVIIRAFREMISVYENELGDVRYIMLTKFIFLGAVNTVVDWLWYLALSRSIPFFAGHLVFTKGVAFLIGSIPIFMGNAYWVFSRTPITILDHVKLYSILALAFFIHAAALSGFLVLGFNDITAVILATLTSFVWNLAVAWGLLIKDRVRIPSYSSLPA